MLNYELTAQHCIGIVLTLNTQAHVLWWLYAFSAVCMSACTQAACSVSVADTGLSQKACTLSFPDPETVLMSS